MLWQVTLEPRDIYALPFHFFFTAFMHAKKRLKSDLGLYCEEMVIVKLEPEEISNLKGIPKGYVVKRLGVF